MHTVSSGSFEVQGLLLDSQYEVLIYADGKFKFVTNVDTNNLEYLDI